MLSSGPRKIAAKTSLLIQFWFAYPRNLAEVNHKVFIKFVNNYDLTVLVQDFRCKAKRSFQPLSRIDFVLGI